MTRRLSEHDRRLWARVARTVRAAPGRAPPAQDAAASPTPDLAPEARPGAKPAPASPAPAAARQRRGPPSPPADISAQRRVRRGQLDIDARIDLHGFTQDAAHAALAAFLVREHRAGSRCVLVITGKGRAGAGVLRARLQDWLNDPAIRPLLAGQARAHLRHGGDGAVYLMLKQKRD